MSERSDPTKPKPFSDAYLTRDGYYHTATYPFCDAGGSLQFEKLRYEKPAPEEPKGYTKTFLYRHRANGEWLMGIGEDRERPLYRLENLLKADPGVPVYACESEKICDKLGALGLLVVCHATSWSKTDVEPLRGRKLRLLVDNDLDGKGEAVAAEALKVLSQVAASIRVVRGGPPGGNLADRVDDEITVEKFEELCAKIPETAQAPKHDGEIELHWECMAEVEAEPVDWLWAGRIARGKLTLIAGDPGMGKSQIALDIVARISKGARSPDGNTTPPAAPSC
jgi:putative DNA primase/helicase